MNEVTQLKQGIEKSIGERFAQLTSKETFQTELSFALQHINKNPYLKKATFESNVQAVLNIAQTGLTLNPVMKFAYLVPRFQNGQVETCLEPSYMGLCKLVTDTGSARKIYAHPVHEGDEFDVSLGLDLHVTHKPKFKSKKITHVYSVAILSDGSPMVEVMTREEIEDIQERSESFKSYKAGRIKSCVWISDFAEMCRKTVIRRLVKYLPKTEVWDKLATAVNLDETDFKATDGQIMMIESLLLNVAIPHEDQSLIDREIPTMTAERASEVIQMLQENQLDPIRSGNNYSQTDIKQKIQKEI
jgi:recombination protein RecT